LDNVLIYTSRQLQSEFSDDGLSQRLKIKQQWEGMLDAESNLNPFGEKSAPSDNNDSTLENSDRKNTVVEYSDGTRDLSQGRFEALQPSHISSNNIALNGSTGQQSKIITSNGEPAMPLPTVSRVGFLGAKGLQGDNQQAGRVILERLKSQPFSDINVTVTQDGKVVNIFFRDFSRRYTNYLFDFVTRLIDIYRTEKLSIESVYFNGKKIEDFGQIKSYMEGN